MRKNMPAGWKPIDCSHTACIEYNDSHDCNSCYCAQVRRKNKEYEDKASAFYNEYNRRISDIPEGINSALDVNSYQERIFISLLKEYYRHD